LDVLDDLVALLITLKYAPQTFNKMAFLFRAARHIRVPPVSTAAFATAAGTAAARPGAQPLFFRSAVLLGVGLAALPAGNAGFALCADSVEPATGISFEDTVDGMPFLGAGVRYGDHDDSPLAKRMGNWLSPSAM